MQESRKVMGHSDNQAKYTQRLFFAQEAYMRARTGTRQEQWFGRSTDKMTLHPNIKSGECGPKRSIFTERRCKYLQLVYGIDDNRLYLRQNPVNPGDTVNARLNFGRQSELQVTRIN